LETKIAEQSAALRKAPGDAVVLSTIHSAKGLEWDVVFMIGVEDGVLPHANNDDVEEERRVAYVGVTRAKRLLGLTYANERYAQDASPSPFLHELAGRQPRLCVWTGPGTDGSDERLPLLSRRERDRLAQGLPSEPERQPASKLAVGREQRRKRDSAPGRSARREAAEQQRMARNKIDGVPARQ